MSIPICSRVEREPFMAVIEVLNRAPSTMDAGRTRIQQGAVRMEAGVPTPFAGILAHEQTAGRGQRGRVWSSRPGASLCATFYFRHGLDLPAEIGMVALLAGIATATVLLAEAANVGSAADIGLKWPNDIIIDGKKAGGILVETARTPEGQTIALIGIGINLVASAFPPELASTAASLESAGIVVRDPIVLAANVAGALQAQAERFCHDGRAGLIASWRTLDRTAGRRYHTECASGPTTGIAEGIDDSGRLVLRLPDRSLLVVGSASTLHETLS